MLGKLFGKSKNADKKDDAASVAAICLSVGNRLMVGPFEFRVSYMNTQKRRITIEPLNADFIRFEDSEGVERDFLTLREIAPGPEAENVIGPVGENAVAGQV